MPFRDCTHRIAMMLLLCAGCAPFLGCLGTMHNPDERGFIPADRMQTVQKTIPYTEPLPRELEMVSMPEYVIEPPDVLRIRTVRLVPKRPYRVGPLDGLSIRVTDVADADLISGTFVVDPDGNINIGPRSGGPLNIVDGTDGTLAAIADALQKHLRDKAKFPDARVMVTLAASRAIDPIQGEHLVQPDGTVYLEAYGTVRVVGLTLTQAKAAIEAHLSTFFQSPEIAVSIAAFKSKVYYVVFDAPGRGQQMVVQPITGNDTVLKAIGQAGGSTSVTPQSRMWIARPAPADSEVELIMPIDWMGIVTRGKTKTNYQLMPGDRLYVQANPLGPCRQCLSRLFAPCKRIFGEP